MIAHKNMQMTFVVNSIQWSPKRLMIRRPVAVFQDDQSPDLNLNVRSEAERVLQLQIKIMLIAMAVLECANSAANFALPFYVDDIIGLGKIGIIISIYYIISLSTASWFGLLSDKLGRKRFIVTGAFIIGITYLPFPIFESIEDITGIDAFIVLLIASVGKGFGSAMMAGSIIAIFADISTEETRGEMMGKFYLFRAAGGAVGFVIGGVLWDLMNVAGFICFAFIIFLAGLLFLRMREPRKFAIMIRELQPPLETTNPFASMLGVLKNRQFRTFSLVWLSYTSMIGIIVTYLPKALHQVSVEGSEEEITGLSLGIIILLVLIIAGAAQPIYGHLSDRYGRKPFILLGVQSTAIEVFLLYQLLTQPKTIVQFINDPFSSLEVNLRIGNIDIMVSSFTLLIVLMALLLAAAAFPASAMGLLTDVTDEEERGQGMGLYSALSAVGNILGIFAGGIFYEWYSIQGLMALCLFFAFLSTLIVLKFLIETTTFRWMPSP